MTSPTLIAPTEVAATAATVVDVRTPAEFETAHIPGAVNVPLPLVQAHADTLAGALQARSCWSARPDQGPAPPTTRWPRPVLSSSPFSRAA